MGDDRADEVAAGGPAVRYPLLTFALMGGAVVWLLRLVANTALVPLACDMGATWPLWLSTGASVLVGLAALAASWRLYRAAPPSAAGAAGGDGLSSLQWLGLLGVLFNVTAVAGIVLESAPIAVLDICRSVGG